MSIEAGDDRNEGTGPAAATAERSGGTAQARRPRRVMAGAVVAGVAGLLIGGAVGFVGGWQVEKGRIEDDISHIRPVGVVVDVSDDSVTVRTGGERREYRLSEDTVVDTATVGGPRTSRRAPR
ncbi:MAG: hypothetical protein KatS3mg010_1525 [Acidimicrobiia bacterium]|nr:MAG: hypothetical protein KatS3mg010_1525 [Acidimicrobiia bacterium]